MPYYTYIVKCSDNTFYIGYTTDLENRIKSHNTSKTGAKYTRPRRPVELQYYEEFTTLSDALKREYQLKKLTRKEKRLLILK